MSETGSRYMQEALTRDMAVALVEKQGMSLTDALNTVYSSDTFRRLSDPRTMLYTQSPVYLYDCLDHELRHGKAL